MSITKRLLMNAFYYNPGSVFSNIGELILHEKGIHDAFEMKPIQMGIDNIAPWYIQLNPKGQVPTLVHQGHAIADTLQIAKYVDTAFGDTRIFDTDNQQVLDLIEEWRTIRVLSLTQGKKSVDQDVAAATNTLKQSRQQVLLYMQENPHLSDYYKIRLATHDDRVGVLVDHSRYRDYQSRLINIIQKTETALQENNGCLLNNNKKRTLADIYVSGILYWLQKKLPLQEYNNLFTNKPNIIRYYNLQYEYNLSRLA